MLKNRLPPATLQRARIEEWIQQAQALSSGEAGSSHFPGSEEAITDTIDRDDAEWRAKQPSIGRRSWREIADFFVSFGFEVDEKGDQHLKTRVHHSQADQLMQWDGVASELLLTWLLEQANLAESIQAPEPSEERADEDSVRQEEELFPISLSNPWVSEVQVPAGEGGLAKRGYLRVRSEMSVSGSARESYINEGIKYAVDIYLVDTETNLSTLAGTFHDQLVADKTLYTIQTDFQIPPLGRYQLYLIARLSPPASVIVHTQGPIIHVEP